MLTKKNKQFGLCTILCWVLLCNPLFGSDSYFSEKETEDIAFEFIHLASSGHIFYMDPSAGKQVDVLDLDGQRLGSISASNDSEIATYLPVDSERKIILLELNLKSQRYQMLSYDLNRVLGKRSSKTKSNPKPVFLFAKDGSEISDAYLSQIMTCQGRTYASVIGNKILDRLGEPVLYTMDYIETNDSVSLYLNAGFSPRSQFETIGDLDKRWIFESEQTLMVVNQLVPRIERYTENRFSKHLSYKRDGNMPTHRIQLPNWVPPVEKPNIGSDGKQVIEKTIRGWYDSFSKITYASRTHTDTAIIAYRSPNLEPKTTGLYRSDSAWILNIVSPSPDSFLSRPILSIEGAHFVGIDDNQMILLVPRGRDNGLTGGSVLERYTLLQDNRSDELLALKE